MIAWNSFQALPPEDHFILVGVPGKGALLHALYRVGDLLYTVNDSKRPYGSVGVCSREGAQWAIYPQPGNARHRVDLYREVPRD